MQSKFYQPDEQRAAKVHELFVTIARRYDLLNDLMSAGLHRRWKRRLIALAGVAASVPDASATSRRDGGGYTPRVLDLCCGTGDLTIKLIQLGAVDAEIVGLDYSQPMLDIAAKKVGDVSL